MSVQEQARTPRNWKPIAALLLLCLFWSMDSLRPDLFPHPVASPAPQLEREALPLVLLALVATAFSFARLQHWPRGRQRGSSIAIGLGLFTVPALLLDASHSWISAFTRVTIFSLTSVFAVVLEPYIDPYIDPNIAVGHQSNGALLAALAAVAGTLCIFPVDLPSTLPSALAFAAVLVAALCVTIANCFAVRVAIATPAIHIAPMAAIASATAALSLIAATAFTGSLALHFTFTDLSWSAIVDLSALILLFWLMPRMSAARMTTRFVIAPFIAILVGMALEQPSVSFRTWAGLLLIAIGAGWLLCAPDQHPESLSSPLNLPRG